VRVGARWEHAEVAVVIALDQRQRANALLAREFAERVIEIAPRCDAQIGGVVGAKVPFDGAPHDVERGPARARHGLDDVARSVKISRTRSMARLPAHGLSLRGEHARSSPTAYVQYESRRAEVDAPRRAHAPSSKLRRKQPHSSLLGARHAYCVDVRGWMVFRVLPRE
jgi:hypothetical protein